MKLSPQIIWIIIICFVSHNANGQSLSNLRKIKSVVTTQKIVSDTLYIIPSTVNVYIGHKQYTDTDSIFYIQGKSILLTEEVLKTYENREIEIEYRVFPANFQQQTALIDSSKVIIKDQVIYIGHDLTPTNNRNPNQLIASDELNYDGNFTRGFSVGNSQSLVLNSNFNLQLSGDLGDDMSIQAAISDDNLPIQAEGNTQLLQEFDKVYIKVNKDKTSFIAGDYDLKSPNGYFLKYFKKLKGLQVINQANINTKNTLTTSGNFAISRGKFARNTLPVREGNQGPYKLFGNEGERILKILSGTEKVYVDGKLAKRGLDYDYIISYDRSEILFTTRLLVTKDRRIIVEFEYADQNYLRSQYSLGTQFQTEKHQVNFNFYSEQDSKTTTGDIDLDSTDLRILTMAGDDPNLTFRRGERSIMNELTNEQNYYRSVFEQTIADSILVYTSDLDSAQYVVTFSDVGVANGSYVIDPVIGANGRAYRWVGIGNGAYEPIVRLIAPEKRIMMSLNAKSQLRKNVNLYGEFALSKYDINRFSEVDNEDNIGYGTRLGYDQSWKLGNSDRFTIRNKGNIEYVKSDFSPMNPFRAAEFSRDWSIVNREKTDERIHNFSVGITDNQLGDVNYNFGGYNRKDQYNGLKHTIDFNLRHKGWKAVSNSSFLSGNNEEEDILFSRPNLLLEKTFEGFHKWRIGYYYESEKNQKVNSISNDYNLSSFQYILNKYYIKNIDLQHFNFGLSYNTRSDQVAESSGLKDVTYANEIEFFGLYHPSKNSNLDWNFTIRNLDVSDPNLTIESDKTSYLGRVDYTFAVWNNGIRSTTSYIVSSGQESKAEFEYIQVEKGEGQYVWIDDGDGLQTVNEFQISPVQDTANFVRVTIINNEFIRTLSNGINQSLRIDGRNLITNEKREKSVYKTLSKFSTISSFRIQQKTEDFGLDNTFRPFSFSIQDTSLVSFTSFINNTLFFNRGDPKYDIQIGQKRNINKQVFVTGFEQNGFEEYFSRLRFNIRQNIDLTFQIANGENQLDSEFFDQNDYNINFWKWQGETTVRPNNSVRFQGSYEYITKQNNSLFSEEAKSHNFTFSSSVRQSNNTSFDLGVSFVNVSYVGSDNAQLEFVILDGLKDGRNFLWNIGYSRKLSRNVEMLIAYDGRKTGSARTIHTARAQVKANF